MWLMIYYLSIFNMFEDVDKNYVFLVFLWKHNPQHFQVSLKFIFLKNMNSKNMRKTIIYLRSAIIELFVWETGSDKQKKSSLFTSSFFFFILKIFKFFLTLIWVGGVILPFCWFSLNNSETVKAVTLAIISI